MQRLVIMPLMLLLFITLNAQFKTIAEGPVFEEPVNGFGRILQLKNGSTVFLHITIKDGINVRVYDEKHAEKAVQNIEPAYGKLKDGQIESIFEINGDCILLISEMEGKPALYRLVVDGKNGTLKSETTIATLDRLSMRKSHALGYFNIPTPSFYAKKDPYSDNYAVVIMNGFEEDRNKRLQVVFFNKDHKEMSRANYNSPEDKYKYMKYIDVVVVGEQSVNVLAYAFNTRSSGGKESELIIATLEKDADTVSLNELNFTKDFVVNEGITLYNPVTKRIVLLAAAKDKAKANRTTYIPFMAFIDPYIGTLEHAAVVYPKKAGNEAIALFGDKEEFTGLPQNMFINKDGTVSVVFEEMKSVSSNSSGYTILGNMAVAIYDHDGKEVTSYLIPKSQKMIGWYLSPFYNARDIVVQRLYLGNQYKSFSYLAGVNKPYLLINDVEENTEKVMRGKLTTVSGVGECDGFYYPLSGKNVLPNRDFVFGAPDRKSHNLALFAISDYNDKTNQYATLKLVKGKSEGVSLIWLAPL